MRILVSLLFLLSSVCLNAQTAGRVLQVPPPAPAEQKPGDTTTPKTVKPTVSARPAAQAQKVEDMLDSFKTMEKGFWQAWQNRDAKVFDQHMSQNALMVDNTGIADRATALKGLGACDVKGYDLGDFKLTKIDNDAALLTYKATNVQAVCDGQKAPATIYASTVFTKSAGKWWMTFHQESAAIPNETVK